MSATLTEHASSPTARATGRLLVTVQESDTRKYRSIGFLDCSPSAYRFTYLSSAYDRHGFRPLPGLGPDRMVESAHLFPLFADRIMSPRRPDQPHMMTSLGLPANAAPFEVLARSGGRRVGDLLELVEVPVPDQVGRIELTFLVHGVRYAGAEATAAIDRLKPGDQLRLVPDPGNPKDAQAIAVEQSVRLGFVPRPLTDLARELMAGSDHRLTVERANDASAGFHMRLLVTLTGTVQGVPFTGPEWA